MFRKKTASGDPLQNPAFREPGLLDKLREVFLGVQKPLDTVQIEISSFCMGRCSYCPHTTMSKRWHSRHMEPEVLASLWPFLRNASRAHLQGWGEPLLHPRFFEYVKFAQKAGCQTSTTSCGLTLNEENIEKLAQSGLDVIAFSFVGTDENSNNARANVHFDKVCENIRKLSQKIAEYGQGPEIHLAYLLLADRMGAAAKLPFLMESLNATCAIVSTLDYLASPDHKNLAFTPSEENKLDQAKEILEAAAEQARLDNRLIVYGLPDSMINSPNGCRENISNSLYVDAEGQISPCIYLNIPAEKTENENVIFGNSLEEEVWRVWQKPEYREFRERLGAGEPPHACQNCPKRKESVRS